MKSQESTVYQAPAYAYAKKLPMTSFELMRIYIRVRGDQFGQ